MKKGILSIFLAALTLSSCIKDALEVNPLDQLSSASFWKTESDVQSALTACYSFFKRGGNWYGTTLQFPAGWDALSDDGYTQYDYGSANSISFSGPTPTSSGYVSDAYTVDYQAIAAINYFMANIGKVTLPDASKKKYLAEANFLRAFYYFQLATLYGNVILIKEPAIDTFKEPRAKSTKDEVLAFVNEELDKAITDLPDVAYADGHAVKGSAQALKARVLLYQKKYPEAAAMAKNIIDGGKYKLWANYKELFYKPGQNNNTEIIFSIKNLPPNSYPDPGVDLFQGSWQAVQPTKNLIDEYEAKDGQPIGSSPVYDPAKPYDNRDPRLRMSFFVPGDGAAEGWNKYNGKASFNPFVDANTTGFAVKKMLDPSRSDPQYSTQSDQDYVLMRYAEVLLNYAEAENEANGPANAYAAVNQIRTRAGMPALPTGLTKDQMRERIRHERRVELAMEGLRYYDLRRWGIALQKLNGFKIVPGNNNLKDKYYEARFDIWPLPQTDIDRNSGLKQNDGY